MQARTAQLGSGASATRRGRSRDEIKIEMDIAWNDNLQRLFGPAAVVGIFSGALGLWASGGAGDKCR